MKLASTLGVLACAALPAWGAPVLSDVEARLVVESGALGGTVVHLLSGGPFGRGGLARGGLDLTGTPPPDGDIVWRVENGAGRVPPDDERILSFAFDETGDFAGVQPTPFYDPDVASGVDPQPFRILLATLPDSAAAPSGILGELDFRDVSGVSLGSLRNITGLRLVHRTDGGPDLTFDPFTIAAYVPEPATVWLMAPALAGLWVAPRRGRRGRSQRLR